jgi:hypothetical protein
MSEGKSPYEVFVIIISDLLLLMEIAFDVIFLTLHDFFSFESVFTAVFCLGFLTTILFGYRIRITKTLIKLYEEFHNDYDVDIVDYPGYFFGIITFKALLFRIENFEIILFEQKVQRSYQTFLECKAPEGLKFSFKSKCILAESVSHVIPGMKKKAFLDPDLKEYYTIIESEGDILSSLLSDEKTICAFKKLKDTDSFNSIGIWDIQKDVFGKRPAERFLRAILNNRIDLQSSADIVILLGLMVHLLNRINSR